MSARIHQDVIDSALKDPFIKNQYESGNQYGFGNNVDVFVNEYKKYVDQARKKGMADTDLMDINSYATEMSSYGSNQPVEDLGAKARSSEFAKWETKTGVEEQKGKTQAGIEELINYAIPKKQKYLEEFKTGRATRLEDISNLLMGQSERVFSEEAPDILEALNTRGLLTSTATGTAMAKEKSRLQQIVGENLQGVALQDQSLEEALGADIIDTEFGLREKAFNMGNELDVSGLERMFDLTDISNTNKYASQLAGMQADATQKANDQMAIGNIANILAQAGIGIATGGASIPFTAGLSVAGKSAQKNSYNEAQSYTSPYA